MIKIALCGTHGIGKTTMLFKLAYLLKQRGYNVHIINETARSCPLPINKDATLETQKWILGKQLITESILEYKKDKIDFILCDRSILDIFIYSLMIDKSYANSILPLMKYHMKTFNLIFYLQKDDSHFRNDGERCFDSDFRNRINDLFLKTIMKYNIPAIKIESINLEKYINLYLSKIKW